MTSKNSFWKYSIWNIKKRSWILFCSIGLMFFSLPLSTYLSVSGRMTDYWALDVKSPSDYQNLCYSIITGNIYQMLHLFIAVILAMLMAIQGMSWLNKRQAVDLYRSVPVKEKTRFLYIHLNSLIMYAAPLALGLLASNLVIVGYGIYNLDFLKASLCIFAVCLLTFVAVYMMTLIAQLLTGNVVLAFLGGLFFLFAEAVCRLSIEEFRAGFLDTFVNFEIGYGRIVTDNVTSPLFTGIGAFCAIQNRLLQGYDTTMYLFRLGRGLTGYGLRFVLLLVIQSVAYMAVAWLLYHKRAAQTGGKAVVFLKAVPFIQFLLVFTISIGTGVLMVIAGNYYENPALYGFLGIVLAAIVLHLILRAIMDGEFNAIIKKPAGRLLPSLAACGLGCLIFSCFAFDLFHYDTYLPKEEELDSFAFVRTRDYFIRQNINNDRTQETYLDQMKITDEGAKKLLLTVIADAISRDQYDSYDAFSGNEEHSVREDLGIDSDLVYTDVNACETVDVAYHLKNGKDVQRQYCLSMLDIRKIYAAVYDTDEYKEVADPFQDDFVTACIRSADYEKGITYTSFDFENLSEGVNDKIILPENAEALSKAMKEDFYDRTYEDLLSHVPVGEVDMEIEKPLNDDHWYRSDGDYIDVVLPVYDCDVRTIALLKELGIYQDTAVVRDQVEKLYIYENRPAAGDENTQYVLEVDGASGLAGAVLQDVFPMRAQWCVTDADMLADQTYFVKIVSKKGEAVQYALYANDLPQNLEEAMKKAVVNEEWESRSDW